MLVMDTISGYLYKHLLCIYHVQVDAYIHVVVIHTSLHMHKRVYAYYGCVYHTTCCVCISLHMLLTGVVVVVCNTT